MFTMEAKVKVKRRQHAIFWFIGMPDWGEILSGNPHEPKELCQIQAQRSLEAR